MVRVGALRVLDSLRRNVDDEAFLVGIQRQRALGNRVQLAAHTEKAALGENGVCEVGAQCACHADRCSHAHAVPDASACEGC